MTITYNLLKFAFHRDLSRFFGKFASEDPFTRKTQNELRAHFDSIASGMDLTVASIDATKKRVRLTLRYKRFNGRYVGVEFTKSRVFSVSEIMD